jgi:hypothetical protein
MLAGLAANAAAQARVEGTVSGIDGKPVVGAMVRVEGSELKKPRTTTTGADGGYIVDDLKLGQWVKAVAFQDGRRLATASTLVTRSIEKLDLAAKAEQVTEVVDVEELNPAGGPSGDVRGVIRDNTGTPIPGARVTIKETPLSTTADSAGRYSFHHLRADSPVEIGAAAGGYQDAAASRVVVPNGGFVEADLSLEPGKLTGESGMQAGEDELVTESDDSGSASLRPDEASGLPTLTRSDLFRAIQFLPSARGDLEASSELYLRGGTPDQTLVTLDGFNIYPFTHYFGTFSAFNMDAIDSATFSPTASNAADGGRLAGALRMTAAPTTVGTPSAGIDLSTLGWGVHASTPIGGRVSALFAYRATPPTTLYNRVLDEMAGNTGLSFPTRQAVYSGGAFELAPTTSSFHDLNGKISANVTDSDRVSATIYDASDAANLSRNVAEPTPNTDLAEPALYAALPADAVAQVSDVQSWTGQGLSAQWERRWSPRARTTVSIGHSAFSKDDSYSSMVTSPSTSVDYSFAAERGGSSGLSESNRISDTTFRVDGAVDVGYQHALSVGGELSAVDTSYALSTEVFSTAKSGSTSSKLDGLVNQTDTGHVATVYAQDSWRPVSSITIAPGVRVMHYDVAGTTYLDPRATVTYELNRWIRISGAWTIDHQTANRITREDLMRGDGEFWALANGTTIAVPRSQQFVVGAAFELPTFLLELRGYYKQLDDLTLFAPRLYPGLDVGPSNTSFYDGSRTAKGVELHLAHSIPENTVWLSLVVSRSDDTFPLLEANSFPSSEDQREAFKLADTYRIGKSWSLGGVFVFGSGRPETPATDVTQVWLPSGAEVYGVEFGPKNSARLPPYHRLDVRAERLFQFDKVSIAVVGTVFNAYDQQNIAYSQYWTTNAQVVATDVTFLRRTYDVALRLRF